MVAVFDTTWQHYLKLHPAAGTRLGVNMWSITHSHDKGTFDTDVNCSGSCFTLLTGNVQRWHCYIALLTQEWQRTDMKKWYYSTFCSHPLPTLMDIWTCSVASRCIRATPGLYPIATLGNLVLISCPLWIGALVGLSTLFRVVQWTRWAPSIKSVISRL